MKRSAQASGRPFHTSETQDLGFRAGGWPARNASYHHSMSLTPGVGENGARRESKDIHSGSSPCLATRSRNITRRYAEVTFHYAKIPRIHAPTN
jgi:hypothetical protein